MAKHPLSLAWLVLFVILCSGRLHGAGQERIERDGDFKEPLSHLAFPLRIAGWERTNILKYPEPGGYSITYELKTNGSLAIATIYVYPHMTGMPATLQEHFATTLAQLRTLGHGGEVVTDTTAPIEREGKVLERRLGTILFRDGFGQFREPTISLLTLSKVDTYWLKWRITVPASVGHEVSQRFAELTGAFVPPLTP